MKRNDSIYMQDSFLRMVLDGSFDCSEEELIRWDEDLGLNLHHSEWVCMVVRLQEKSTCKRITEIVLALKKNWDRILLDKNWIGYSTIGSNMDVLILIKKNKSPGREEIAEMVSTISKRINWTMRVGIGNFYRGLSQIHLSKEDAYETLNWFDDSVLVSDIRDLVHLQGASIATIQSNKRKILQLFRTDAIDQMQKELEILAEQVRIRTIVQPDTPYPTSIRRTMIELLVEMLHIASDSGVDVDEAIDYVDPYRKIFEIMGTPDIIKWIIHIAGILSDAMILCQRRLEQSSLEKVKVYIQDNLADMNLSLTSVSQAVGMSPSYFSAFFIREAGVGFKEYVTAQRILLAQHYLQESSDSINSISEHCGFLSPSYFISVFKNQTGMTPGAYRKMKN